MEGKVFVHIEAPQGDVLENTGIPLDYTAQDATDELVDVLQLPLNSDQNEPIYYALFYVNRNLQLAPQQMLSSAGVQNGDSLRLISSHQIPQPIPSHIANPTVQPRTDEISVSLSVLDLNRQETVNLSTTRKAGDLIRQIVQNYSLPARDKLDQLIKYRLHSKALGRFLEETVSLREAGVPTLDRLTLHREEIAGGKYES